MYYKFSKLAKFAIIFSFVSTVSVICYHGYNQVRIIETNKLIFEMMDRENVLRETAINYLEDEGYELFVGGEFATIVGIIFGLSALFCLYRYGKDNSFFFSITASFLCLITSFVSGFLLFYVIFSGKSEVNVENEGREYHNDWERFISQRSKENKLK